MHNGILVTKNAKQGDFNDCTTWAVAEAIAQQLNSKYEVMVKNSDVYKYIIAHTNAFSYDDFTGMGVMEHMQNIKHAFDYPDGFMMSHDKQFRIQIRITWPLHVSDMDAMKEKIN